MIEKFTFGLAYVVLTAALLLALLRFRSASPVFWHPVALAVMALGTISLATVTNEVDQFYIFLHFVAFFAYTLTALIYVGSSQLAACLHAYKQRVEVDVHQNVKLAIIAIATISAFITILYYSALGFNVVTLLLSGAEIDGSYSDLRISAYSGDQYFAPGYVNQFKNVLLPISLTCIGYWIYKSRPRFQLLVYIAVALPFALFALAGTGQRGFLFYTIASVAMGLILHRMGKKTRISPVIAAGLAVPVVGLFVMMTYYYYLGSAQASGNVFADVLARFTSIQQESALAGFRYVYLLDTAWGGEWLQALRGLLPGQEGSRLAHEIHAVLYGSDRGTAPVSTIGSAYHNGGLFGVIFLFGFLGWIYAAAYRHFLNGPRNIVRSIAYGFMFFYLTIWVADAPTILLDNGVFTVMLLLFILKLAAPRPQQAVPLAPGGSSIGGTSRWVR